MMRVPSDSAASAWVENCPARRLMSTLASTISAERMKEVEPTDTTSLMSPQRRAKLRMERRTILFFAT